MRSPIAVVDDPGWPYTRRMYLDCTGFVSRMYLDRLSHRPNLLRLYRDVSRMYLGMSARMWQLGCPPCVCHGGRVQCASCVELGVPTRFGVRSAPNFERRVVGRESLTVGHRRLGNAPRVYLECI